MNLDNIISNFPIKVRQSPSMKGLLALIQTFQEQLHITQSQLKTTQEQLQATQEHFSKAQERIISLEKELARFRKTLKRSKFRPKWKVQEQSFLC